MTDTKWLISHLDDTIANHVTPKLGATIRQLHEWTGEFPASASGAAPATTSPNDRPCNRPDCPNLQPCPTHPEPSVKLTKVEADALNPDEARRALVRCYELIDKLVSELGDLGDTIGGETLPHPPEQIPARLAFIQWQINKLIRLHLPATTRLETAARHANELATICDRYRPAPKHTRPNDVCHAHDSAGADSAIDSKYRRWHLCRWCGDFRSTHGVNPPAKLVKLHDRGISMSTSLLRSAGIGTTKNGGAA